jgi:hypothetical protein
MDFRSSDKRRKKLTVGEDRPAPAGQTGGTSPFTRPTDAPRRAAPKPSAPSGPTKSGASAPARSLDGDDLCPGEPWCVVEVAAWGDGARFIYCRSNRDLYKAKRAHPGLPLFLRVELRTLAAATAGQTDEETATLLRRIFRLKAAADRKAKGDMWVMGFEDGAVRSGSRPPAEPPLAQYTKAIERAAKAMAWFDGAGARETGKKRLKAEAAFNDLLAEIAKLGEQIAATGREMTPDEILHGFKEAS